MKRTLIFLLALVLTMSAFLAGCTDPSDLLDDQADDFASAYVDLTPVPPAQQDVLDTLDLMLDQYVSGLQKPAPTDIPQITLDPDTVDPADQPQFVTTDQTCASVDEMRALLLQAMTDTEGAVQFHALNTFYNNDVLYDVIFNQLCDTYMIETMGLHEYTVTTMAIDDQQTAVEVEFHYFGDKYTLEQVQDMKDETLAKAKSLVRDLSLGNLSPFERVQAVNTYLINNCVYPDTEPYSRESHSPYGTLIEQSSVCEGYARAAQLIFELCDVPSYYVVGDTPNGGHAWNLVQLDGNWYQLDITWNDTSGQHEEYFLVTDDFMSLSRTWDRQKYPATATTPYL